MSHITLTDHRRLLKGTLVGILSATLLCSLAACNSSVSGGTQSSASSSPTLGSDIASQLKTAQPKDFTYSFMRSDANANHGEKLGDGVETRNPDLVYQKWMGIGQTPSVEQMIDYQSAVFYQRVSGAGQWDRTSSNLAHYYDLQNPKVLGTETLNGAPAYRIRATQVKSGQNVTFDVWARTDNLYPAQFLSLEPIGSQLSYFLFVITAYNTGATLSLPTDVTP
jgi:hypothetical protein